MFGYVTVCKECMREEDYKLFEAYYCGLCKETGKQCSQLARLGLSYDMTFLAVVLSAMEDKAAETEQQRCLMHPQNKRCITVNNRAVQYAANMGTLLTYLKFLDDWQDEHSIKALAGMLTFYGGVRKAKIRFEKQYNGIRNELKRLDECEKNNAGIDEAAACFARVLEILFTPDFIKDKTDRKILGWFGYNVGRWIYVIDAYNDIDKDLKKKCYNPFIKELGADIERGRQRLKDRLKVSLTLNLDTIASTYELLTVFKNDGVIRHIVYTSLYARQNNILGETDGSI